MALSYEGLNHGLFQRMMEPHESAEALSATLKEFFEELGALREKHKLLNLYVIVHDSIKTTDGSDGGVMWSSMYGDEMHAEAMTAWAFGQEQLERQERTAKMLGRSLKKEPKRK